MSGAGMKKEFHLRDIRVHVDANELHKLGGVERLEPKVMAVLCFLAEHSGKIVTKEEIREGVWNGMIVSDAALMRIISLLRKALGDSAQSPVFIETISKKGYRLIVEPAPVTIGKGASEPKSNGVKVFVATIQTSLMAFATPPTGRIVTVAAGLAAVVTALVSAFSLQQHQETSNESIIARADALYQQFEYEANENAIALYEIALESENSSGKAYSGLSSAMAQRYYLWSENLEDLKGAKAFAHQAIELSPEAAHGHKALGLALEYAGDLDGALESYLNALEYNDNHWPSIANIGDLYFAREEYQLALNWFTRAHALADNKIHTAAKLGKTLVALGRLNEAARWFTFILEREPLHRNATAALAQTESNLGNSVAAIERCDHLLSRFPDDVRCGMVKTDFLIARGEWRDAEKALEMFAANVPLKWAHYVVQRRTQLDSRLDVG